MRISDWSSDVCSSDLEHGADLVIAEILGQIAPVETAEALAAPDKVRKKPLAGAGGECVQRGRLARGSMLAQIFIELRLVADHGFSARLLLLPLGGQGCACGPRCYGQQHGQQRDATAGPSHRAPRPEERRGGGEWGSK